MARRRHDDATRFMLKKPATPCLIALLGFGCASRAPIPMDSGATRDSSVQADVGTFEGGPADVALPPLSFPFTPSNLAIPQLRLGDGVGLATVSVDGPQCE